MTPPSAAPTQFVLPAEAYVSTRSQRDSIRSKMAGKEASLQEILKVVYYDYTCLQSDAMEQDCAEAVALKEVIVAFEQLYDACENDASGRTMQQRLALQRKALEFINEQEHFAYCYQSRAA